MICLSYPLKCKEMGQNKRPPDTIPLCRTKRAMLNDHCRCHPTKFGDYNRKWRGSPPTLQG
uniref:Uncharacterized protein n=1 Tax=Romanomermis culicivorax TaxID=13658 RepID=A0A915I418_ROMCU